VASDRAADSRRLPEKFGVVITGERLVLDEESAEEGYRGLRECPILLPIRRGEPALLDELPRVASNRPSYIRAPGRLPYTFRLLAVLPRTCHVDGEEAKPNLYGFAVGGKWGEGRVLVLADHSVFINDMMMQPDNDNFEFAYRALDWLTEREGGGRRSRVLFLEETRVQTDFAIPVPGLPSPSPPPLGVLVQVVNQGLRGLEEENAFNRMILDRLGRANRLRLAQAGVVVLTIALAVYALNRLTQSRYQVEQGSPLLETALSRAAPAPLASEARRKELLAGGNLWESAHFLARQWFEVALGSPLSEIERRQSYPLFKARVRGGLWRRWALGHDVRHVWRLARQSRGGRVSPRGLARIRRRIRRLDDAVEAGVLRFEVPEERG
jgi:hypothetical protein